MFVQSLVTEESKKMSTLIRDTKISSVHKMLALFNTAIDFTGYALAYYEDLHTDVAYQVVRRVSSRSFNKGEHWATVESFSNLDDALLWLSGVEVYQKFVSNDFIDPNQVTR